MPFIEPSEQADHDRRRGNDEMPTQFAPQENQRDGREQARHEHATHGKADEVKQLVEVREQLRAAVARNR
jgi:hypothetical protein